MSINDFLTKENTDLLWEVLIDDDILKYKSKEIITQINNIFKQNLSGFYEVEKNNSQNLITMNKKFITIIMNYINKQQQQSQQSQKKELITSTDLQSERISQFEKDLNLKQTEFTNAMSLPVPPVPKFNDTNVDEPISEMELEMKKVIDQRNYDIEQVNRQFNKSGADTWLKSQDTSIKNEKLTPPNKNTEQNKNMESFKYIKIEKANIENNILKKDIIDLSQKKHISWEDENIIEENITFNIVEEDDIFKKLKKIIPKTEAIVSLESPENNLINIKINTLENKVDDLNDKVNLILRILTQSSDLS